MNSQSNRLQLAIIGGGPGGLMTAYLLEQRYQAPVDITLLEASDRLGGKIVTRKFEKCNAIYEAGAAELYDYSAVGADPLRDLVAELGLTTHPMGGRGVFLGDQFLRTEEDLARVAGREALAIYNAFTRRARSLISPEEYSESDWKEDNGDPLARQTLDAFLSGIKNETVRRYIEVAIHSDIATEPTHTSAMYGLQNFLMNEPGYMSLYGINGGIERLPRELARRLGATVHLNSAVHRVEAIDGGKYRVSWRSGGTEAGGREASGEFDSVVVALPNYWIPSIDWSGPALAKAMREHHAHYDYPAHYLRVSVLFREPFWRNVVADSYFMIDAFGGCCVYDETSRCADSSAGILGFLIGGEAALSLNNLNDQALIARVLDSLPATLRHGRELIVEGHVHRWAGAVNAMPGGFPLHEPDSRHVPDPVGNPMLFLVGDYLFDSTLNGVLDSAECVAEWITGEIAEDVPTVDTMPSMTQESPAATRSM
jgi:protoporphyrinogen oxidase